MASSLLFDVVLVDGNNDAVTFLRKSVPMAEAIKLSTKHNGSAATLIAVVAMQGSVAASIDSTALGEQDDSDVTEGTENAAEANVADALFEGVASRRAKFVQRELRKQIKRIWAAVPLVTDGADLGIVAASLEVVARGVDGVLYDEINHENFDYGLNGDLRYTELEDALGVVRRDLHELRSKVLG